MICKNIMCLWTSLLYCTVQTHTSCKLPQSFVAGLLRDKCSQEANYKDQSEPLLAKIQLFGNKELQSKFKKTKQSVRDNLFNLILCP